MPELVLASAHVDGCPGGAGYIAKFEANVSAFLVHSIRSGVVGQPHDQHVETMQSRLARAIARLPPLPEQVLQALPALSRRAADIPEFCQGSGQAQAFLDSIVRGQPVQRRAEVIL